MATRNVAVRGREMAGEEASAIQRFMDLQEQLLAHYGVKATSRYVELAEPRMRVHLLEAGQGEPVVIFHGDGEAVNWAPLMGPLQESAHIFAVDRPGFGLSDAFDYRHVDLRSHAASLVESLLDSLGLETATLVGGSMGGFFALVGALAHPKRVRKIVLVGFAVGVTQSIPVPLRIICGVPGLSHLFMRNRGTMEAQKSQYQQMFHVDPATVPDLYFETRIAGIALPSEQGTWATMLPRVGSLRGVRPEVYLGDELTSIQAPVLLIWGEHDMAPVEVARSVAARMPQARLEYLPGIGHFPFLEAPDHVARLISSFLDEGASA